MRALKNKEGYVRERNRMSLVIAASVLILGAGAVVGADALFSKSFEGILNTPVKPVLGRFLSGITQDSEFISSMLWIYAGTGGLVYSSVLLNRMQKKS